jgi:hypothetical protein
MVTFGFHRKETLIYKDVAQKRWGDWLWRLGNELKLAAAIDQVVYLTTGKRQACQTTSNLFQLHNFIAQTDPENSCCKQKTKKDSICAMFSVHSSARLQTHERFVSGSNPEG